LLLLRGREAVRADRRLLIRELSTIWYQDNHDYALDKGLSLIGTSQNKAAFRPLLHYYFAGSLSLMCGASAL
jgi:hypothetical protein